MKLNKTIVNQRMKPLLGHYKLYKLDRAIYHRALFQIAVNSAIEEDEILIRNCFTKVILKELE
ncbi:hypothetical protein LYSBPC_02660 [Lysinibacillus piscis]|uniref:Uncharacterized protein n=1 Tax=Lysinibacillus piscis TaxID=2518931 RepID=A0ABQ5NGG9_9BACI|nr:hypothetical protein LYSBPC_02660 [Lysinibacillus sp. KH24]